MRVYYVGNRYDGCYYVRCLLPMRPHGWDGDKTSMHHQSKASGASAQGALHSDVVVFQRPDDEAKVAVVDLLKKAGKKVVFDNDDTYLPNSGTPTIMFNKGERAELEKLNKNIYDFVKKADLVTTTTEFLAEEYRKHSDNVVVLPNLVDPDDWGEPLYNDGDKIRLGFVGSVCSNDDYKKLKPLIRKLDKTNKYTFVVFAFPPNSENTKHVRSLYQEDMEFWSSLSNIDWQPIVPHAEYQSTLRKLKIDIMLMPRQDSYFNRAKSNIKFLEASMLGVPTIAQGFADNKSPYQQNPEDQKYLRLVTDDKDWEHAIMELNDKDTRRAMGLKAREYVLQNYNINTKAHLWEDAYKTICEQ